MDELDSKSTISANPQDIITDKIEPPKAIPAEQLQEREQLYNRLIAEYKDHYKKKSAHNRILKITFFAILMGLIAFLIVGMVALSFAIIKNWSESAQSITIILSSIAAVLSTIIALPMIICKYLFHKKEDKDLLEFIIKLKNRENPNNDNSNNS